MSRFGSAAAAFVLCVVLHSAVAAAPATTPDGAAQQFLDAWVFRDSAALFALLDPQSRGGQTAESFAAVLDAQPIVPDRHEIVSTEPSATGATVRFRMMGTHATAGTPMTLPGTLEVVSAPEGEQGLRVRYRFIQPPAPAPVAAPASTAPAAAAVGLPPSQTIDGLTSQDILTRATERQGNIQTMTMDLNMRGNMMGDALNLSGSFAYRAPNQMRLDVGQALFVFDGLQGLCYIPDANAYFNLPASFGSEIGSLVPGLGGAQTQASLVSREMINGRSTYHLAMAPQGASPAAGMSMGGPMEVWLDAETFLPAQARTSMMGMSMQMSFSNVQVNAGGVTDEMFQFTPPTGAMEIPMALPGLSGLGGGF